MPLELVLFQGKTTDRNQPVVGVTHGHLIDVRLCLSHEASLTQREVETLKIVK